MFLVSGTWGKGIREGGGVRDSLDFWGVEKIYLERGREEWKKKCTLCVILIKDG